MRHFSRGHRALATLLALTIVTAGVPAFASPSSARLSGRILHAGSSSGVPNAIVKVALRPDAKVYESARTDAKGSYSLSGLPMGTYDVAVQSTGGLYVSTAPVNLVAGEKRDLSLSIRPQEPKGGTNAEGEPAPAPPPTEPPPPPPTEPPAPPPAEPTAPPPEKPAETTKQKQPFYRTPWGGALIVVGTALIVGVVAHSSDSSEPATASPSED